MAKSTPKAAPERRHDYRTWAIAAVLGLIVGWWAATSPMSPVAPKDRPVLRFLSRVARLGLWVMFVADQPPVETKTYIVHSRVDEDGNKVLNHGEGW